MGITAAIETAAIETAATGAPPLHGRTAFEGRKLNLSRSRSCSPSWTGE
jgi:hypothetical protein